MTLKKNELLVRDEVDVDFHDPFIMKGYRQPNTDLKTVLWSCFNKQSNECFNVWSHAFAFVYFAYWFCSLFHDNITNPLYWPLLGLAVGILFLFLMSTVAHALNCMSKKARNRCFYFDYAGISIYGMGTGQAMYFYCRKLQNYNSMQPVYFALVSIATAVIANALMCASRRKWCQSKSLFRTLSCLLPFAVNSYPYFSRLWFCETEDDCNITWLPLYQRHAFYLFLLAIMNVTKLPERKYPGKFDLFGQSHHFIHLFVFLASQNMFQFAYNEMNRRVNLLQVNQIQPNFQNTIVLVFFGVAANFVLSSIFHADDEKTKPSKNE